MIEDSLNIGDIIDGVVTNITNFGLFVKFENGQEGLVHISEIANEYVTDISKYAKIGDVVKVKVVTLKGNKIELSIKKLQEKQVENPFLNQTTKNDGFESLIHSFLKKSEEKQTDIRRNLKIKQGVGKKKRSK
ncbi:MAG: S1 RNA-binding domain-containing protein [Candidatus Margulisiibacteriota bacterium]|jgi:S1 RNA binding domain protein